MSIVAFWSNRIHSDSQMQQIKIKYLSQIAGSLDRLNLHRTYRMIVIPLLVTVIFLYYFLQIVFYIYCKNTNNILLSPTGFLLNLKYCLRFSIQFDNINKTLNTCKIRRIFT